MKKYKIHFAPVQGITDWTYRNIHAKFFGGVDAYYTPFIRVEKEDSFRSRDMKDCDPELNSVELLVPQVLGGEPRSWMFACRCWKDGDTSRWILTWDARLR